MTGEAEREKLLIARLCGERVPMRLAPTGVRRLPDPRARDRWDRMRQTSLPARRLLRRAPIAVRAQPSRTGAAGPGGLSPPAQHGTACG
jgi:hypothetical protein